MEQPFSTSKVTVEYFDPHDVYKLLAPGLIPRLPLRNLHWQSHAGPLRSIDALHINLVLAGSGDPSSASSQAALPPSRSQRADSSVAHDDGFQTQIGASASNDTADRPATHSSAPARRHQIPGLRSTPYLKVLLVRCDDNDSYKGHVRAEVREWMKAHTPSSGSKKTNTAENHDAFEWLIVHVVIPNTVAATQPRKSDSASGSEKSSATSRWRPGPSTLLEKFRSDFNSSSKGNIDRVAQIRIGVNDVPYDLLPRVVPAVPTGYTETEQNSENAWNDLISKFRSLILSSFDLRVTQYEEDIKEKDGQRSLPGWNFCTFFILKEGLARGFESVGLVEDALVGYDELSVGLDMIVREQAASGSRSSTSALLNYTEELKKIALRARASIAGTELEEDELVDLQSAKPTGSDPRDSDENIPISATKKPYRDLILANNVSVFDFRCYVFARQLALLLRLGNAWSTREELLAKLKEQQESALHGVAPRARPPKQKEDEREDLTMLSEICRRTLEFIPAVSQVMRNDIFCALSEMREGDGEEETPMIVNDLVAAEIVDNMVGSFAFSIAQQILAQTSTKSLPITPSTLAPADGHEPKVAIPEPKTMMHPARNSSLRVSTGGAGVPRPPPSPNVFPTGRPPSQGNDAASTSFLKAGLEDLAARRAELYALSRNILEECGKKREWSDGWSGVPVVGESTMVDMVEIDLGDEQQPKEESQETPAPQDAFVSTAGIGSTMLRTALDSKEDFYCLYETLTDKALRHYTIADHNHSVQASMADIAVLKYHLGDYGAAASYFWRATPFYGESGWSLLELSMLVMYSRCLKRLQRKDEYVKVMLKLLSKAALAEKERMSFHSSLRIGLKPDVDYPDSDAIKGFVSELIAETKAQQNEMRVPMSSFFSGFEVDGPPEYHDGRDSASLNFKLSSFLFDDFEIEKSRVRISNAGSGSQKEIWFESLEHVTITPGKNRLKLNSNVIVPGSYEIDRIDLIGSNLHLYYEREVGQLANRKGEILKSPHVSLYHRADTLDARLRPSKHLQLDRNNMVDIELDSGWNEINTAEVRVKAATGGLRLLTSEAKCVGSTIDFSKPTEGGLFHFRSIPQRTTFRIRFPYNIEQEVTHVSIRIEVTYTTEHGTFVFSKTPTVPITLALGVNVQDIFKHKALFSRFTVSTSTHSPLRLYKSELLASEAFESASGTPPGSPIVVFPRQPASLLYKITRKRGVSVGPKTQKTMYLRLQYSVLQDEIEALFEDRLTRALRDTPLRTYARLVVSTALPCLATQLGAHELERATLVGAASTEFLSAINWAHASAGLGSDVSTALEAFVRDWQARNPKLDLPTPSIPTNSSSTNPTPDSPAHAGAVKSILIPVDIPSVTIVHTADIRLQPLPSKAGAGSMGGVADAGEPTSTVCTNQLLPATLHLRWTRVWDTATPAAKMTDLEFSYEVVAPPPPSASQHLLQQQYQDNNNSSTWLLGGRRKGHFVIPAPSAAAAATDGVDGDGGGSDGDEGGLGFRGLSSTPDTEAEIPILLIPLREGWLPYPGVEIREVRPLEADARKSQQYQHQHQPQSGAGAGEAAGAVHCETDYRNLGEAVRVVADVARVTLSLDAGGPSGGPLVLDVQPRWAGDGGEGTGRVVA
ncbi:hypothetical protein DL762_003015 [Monosporascus cannonballus]|uniref:Trafficking protein particle complex subunit 11 domain-containing protein n=1 Tax=Monosporascus cannonballus TaxID=155416 RepID=A0ABY0HCD9_9PEZI|nr:hypothetical protein DL762_003015 [Monosporascus cannonballus]